MASRARRRKGVGDESQSPAVLWPGEALNRHQTRAHTMKNSESPPPRGALELVNAKASGLGLVRFNKAKRTITFECWTGDPETGGAPLERRTKDVRSGHQMTPPIVNKSPRSWGAESCAV